MFLANFAMTSPLKVIKLIKSSKLTFQACEYPIWCTVQVFCKVCITPTTTCHSNRRIWITSYWILHFTFRICIIVSEILTIRRFLTSFKTFMQRFSWPIVPSATKNGWSKAMYLIVQDIVWTFCSFFPI